MARIYLKKKKLKKEKLGAAVRAAAEHFCWLDDAASLYCKTNRESVRARGGKKKQKRNKESNWMSFAERPGLMCRRSLSSCLPRADS